MMLGFDGAWFTPIRPRSPPFGNPPPTRVHVLPASIDRHSALSGPPWIIPKKRRCRWCVAASRMFGSRGSMITSEQPVYSPTLMRLSDQVLPPSVVLYNPRSPPPFHSGPGAATYTMFESFGSTTIRAMCSVFFSPTLRHVRPPSSLLYTPSPYDTLRWLLFSPVPTHTIEGFFGSMVIVPIEYE